MSKFLKGKERRIMLGALKEIQRRENMSIALFVLVFGALVFTVGFLLWG